MGVVIAPTAAISSMPYTPDQSMAALKFYYYVLGDKIWNQYGFTDAFSLQNTWFANSTLAIDQGPIIVMRITEPVCYGTYLPVAPKWFLVCKVWDLRHLIYNGYLIV